MHGSAVLPEAGLPAVGPRPFMSGTKLCSSASSFRGQKLTLDGSSRISRAVR
jgi:hypothetical protein